MRRSTLYWISQILGWGLYVSLGLIFILEYEPKTFGRQALIYFIGAAIAILLTHLWRRYFRARSWMLLPLRSVSWRALVAVVLLGFLQSMLLSIAYWALLYPEAYRKWTWLPGAVFIWAFAFLVWFAIYMAIHMAERARRAEVSRLETELAMRDAELRALQAQLNPHFLFNALNTLRALIYQEPARAVTMLEQFASLLRYSLQSGKLRAVKLREELEAVENYLRIEKIRFEERLTYAIEVPPGALDMQLPPMLLQLLVENAVKHGIEAAYEGRVRITAQLRDNVLALAVENTGSLQTKRSGTRIGLENARQRLRLLFGESATLELREAGDAVIATVAVPQPAPADCQPSAAKPYGGEIAHTDRG